MFHFFKELLDNKQQGKFIWLIVLSTIYALLEAAGVGAVLPFMTLFQNQESIKNSIVWEYIQVIFEGITIDQLFIISGLLLLIVFAAKNAFSLFQFKAIYKFTQDFYSSLSTKLLKSYMYKPFAFFLKANSSILTKNVTLETRLVAEQIIEPILIIFSESMVLLCIMIVLFIYNAAISLFSIIVSGILILCVYVVSTTYTKKLGKKRERLNSTIVKISNDALSGIKEIKVLGIERYFLNKYDGFIKEFGHINAINSLINQVPKPVIEILVVTGILGTLLISKLVGDVSNEVFTIFAVYLIAAYRLMPSVNRIVSSIMRLKYIEAGFREIMPALKELIDIELNEQIITNNEKLILKNQLTISDIYYHYPESKEEVLKSINVEIKKGEVVGFIGPSGAGKSTLINIITGLLTATKGNVFVDGIQLEPSNIRAWQNNVSYVPQHIFIADDTLLNNIALGSESSKEDEDRIVEILNKLSLGDLLKSMPLGLNTELGERGARLSGGQIQRIGIARALFRNSDVLILDEATSALDMETEEKVIYEMVEHYKDKTIIIISHRYSILQYCDSIYKIEDGKIIEKSNYKEIT